MVKQITIQYFAKLREERGLEQEKIETNAKTASALYHELKEQHNFSLSTDLCKVSVNCAFAPWDTDLKDGDEVVFIPPVAGG